MRAFAIPGALLLVIALAAACSDRMSESPSDLVGPSFDVAGSEAVLHGGSETPTDDSDSHQVIITQVGGKEFVMVPFEGGGDFALIHDAEGNLIPGSGMRFPGWVTLIDSDAGGGGDFANEPSPSTIAFWIGGDARVVTFDQAVCGVTLFYTSRVAVTLKAKGAAGAVASVSGPAQFDQGPGGDPTGVFNLFSPIGVDLCPLNVITSIILSGAGDGTAIDDLQTSRAAPPLIVVDDEAPVTTNTTATPNPVAVGGDLDLTANVDDTGLGDSDIASAEYSLDGGASFMGMLASDNAFDEVAEDVKASFAAPAQAGVWDLCVQGTDAAGNVGDPECIMLVVYDPAGGFVTGGGWIYSDAGSYLWDPLAEGKANFGFVSKYKKGATVPTGNTEFQFKAGDLNFHSSSYEFLVITMGGTTAQYKGSGTINGGLAPNGTEFGFMIWAGDDSPDTFRIRIWWESGDGTETDVYDNGFDQTIGGGSIVIQTKKK